MIRWPASCCRVRFDGVAGVVVGGGGGLEELLGALELELGLDEVDGDGDVVVVVLDDELGEGGLDDDEELELELLFEADDDPLLEHAPASIPAAAISARPASPRDRERTRDRDPDRIRRLLRTPASTMPSSLAAARRERHPVEPSWCRF